MAMTFIRVAVGTIAAAALLSACASSGNSGKGPASTASNDAASKLETKLATPTSSATPPPAAPTISEDEYKVVVSVSTLTAGTYTFTVKNNGKIVHAINFDGPGVEDATTGDIKPGSTGKVTVALKPGTYRVYCPVGHHKMLGMTTTIAVT